MDDETRTITIEFSLGADGFAGQARDANGTGVAFAGWLGLIAALDTLVAVDGEQAFAVPLGITALAAEPAGSPVTDDQKGDDAMSTVTIDGPCPELVSAGDGERTRFFADAITVKHRGDALDVWQVVALAGCEPPVHRHDRHDEWLQVLEGRITAIVGAARLEAGPGDLVFMPRGVPHGYVVETREATLQVVTSPGGFVEVFTELNRCFGSGGMPVVLAPNHLDLLEPVLAAHGVCLVTPEG